MSRKVGAGENHVCALGAGLELSCWGKNDEGQLGDGTNVARWAPTAVTGLPKVVRLAVGHRMTCPSAAWRWALTPARSPPPARLSAGASTAIGRSRTATKCRFAAPTEVRAARGAVQLSLGPYHSCALMPAGDTLCWGSSRKGAPRKISGLDGAAEIIAGYDGVCALKKDGELRCASP